MLLTSVCTASSLVLSPHLHTVTAPLCAAVTIEPSYRQIPTRGPDPACNSENSFNMTFIAKILHYSEKFLTSGLLAMHIHNTHT